MHVLYYCGTEKILWKLGEGYEMVKLAKIGIMLLRKSQKVSFEIHEL